jgi:GT2 family glycosyltransferase
MQLTSTLEGSQTPLLREDLSIASITVAWNGCDVLRGHLHALLEQSRSLNEIIVVDNASNDGTVELLRRHFPSVTLLTLTENVGVGGGFSAGLKYAVEKGHDWFWLLDQDSVAAPIALQELLNGLGSVCATTARIGILASLPIHRESGTEHFGLLWRDRFVPVPPERAKQALCFVDLVLSSGSLIRREVVREIGFPREDFFIDFVDHEYNLRVRRHGYQIAVVRQSVLYHRLGDPRVKKSFAFGPSRLRSHQAAWRHYYMSRNEVFTVWHLLGTTNSRAFLIFRMLRRAMRIIFCDENKVAKLKMHFMGVRDGLAKDLTRRRDELPRA